MPTVKSTLTYKTLSTRNTHKVPAEKWKQWNTNARTMFNHICSTGLNNPVAISGTDLFGTSPRVEKILNATCWNLAWEAANLIMDLENSK